MVADNIIFAMAIIILLLEVLSNHDQLLHEVFVTNVLLDDGLQLVF